MASVANVVVQIASLSNGRQAARASEHRVKESLKELGCSDEEISTAIGNGVDTRILYRQGVFLVVNQL